MWWGAWRGGCRTNLKEKEMGEGEGGKKAKADSATATACARTARAGNEWKRMRGYS